MDRLTPERRAENMRRIRSAGMRPEMVVRRLVHGAGIRYRLHASDLPGRPDLTFRSRRKVVFVHGCYWHQHAQCVDGHVPKTHSAYWLPKLARNVRRDREVRDELERTGWTVLVVWECETRDTDGVRWAVSRFLAT